MSISTKVGTQLALAVTFTLAGAPGGVEGVPAWSLVPPENGTVTPSADGMAATVALAVEGDTTVKVVADNVQGDIVGALEAVETLTAAPADVLTADAGAITEAPAA